MKTFQDIFHPYKNSFTFMRTVFAMMVILTHSYSTGGFPNELLEFYSHGQLGFSCIGVFSFFLISGFLITRSLENSPALVQFIINRILRLFPAYWACLIITATVFVPVIYFLEHQSFEGLWTLKEEVLKYIRLNFFMNVRRFAIGNLTEHCPFPKVINGSLWTLLNELKCYVVLLFVGSLAPRKALKFCILALTIFLLYMYQNYFLFHKLPQDIFPLPLDRHLLIHLTYFLFGSCFYLFMSKIPYSKILFVISIGLMIVSTVQGFYNIISPFTMAYILFFSVFTLPSVFQKLEGRGDFSYGLYLYGFPIQQILALIGLPRFGVFIHFLGSIFITFFPAAFSHFFIEKPALQLKKKTRQFLTRVGNYS